VMLDLPVPEPCHETEMPRLIHRLESVSEGSRPLNDVQAVPSLRD
jgi:hypothetical protein